MTQIIGETPQRYSTEVDHHRHLPSAHGKTGRNRALTAKAILPGGTAWKLNPNQAIPPLDPDQVLVETTCIGLNPYDWQAVDYGFGVGLEERVVGRDGAGVVIAKGKNVVRFGVGDRVWYCANPALPGSGAFQNFSVHSASEVGHTPDNISDEEAATLGSGLVTAGIILLKTLGLPLEKLISGTTILAVERPWLLVWGGAGATGVFLIQLAHLLGFRVVCAGSPVNHGYLRSLGADVVLDRWREAHHLLDQIRAATNDEVHLAVDNVSSQTASFCQKILEGSIGWRMKTGQKSLSGTQSSRLVSIAGNPKSLSPNSDALRPVHSLRLSFSTTFFGHPDFSVPLLDCFTGLLRASRIQPARLTLCHGGLEGILGGLTVLKNQGAAGYKMIYRLTEDGIIQGSDQKVAEEEFSSDTKIHVESWQTVVA